MANGIYVSNVHSTCEFRTFFKKCTINGNLIEAQDLVKQRLYCNSAIRLKDKKVCTSLSTVINCMTNVFCGFRVGYAKSIWLNKETKECRCLIHLFDENMRLANEIIIDNRQIMNLVVVVKVEKEVKEVVDLLPWCNILMK